MGAPVIQDKQQVIRWMRQGKGNKEIAALLWDQQGVRVTEAAVGMVRKRAGMAPLHVAKAPTIPWTVRPEHRDLWPAKMLRLKARLDAGEELPPSSARWLANWLNKLDREDAVVCYDRNLEEGFYYMKRKPSDGDSLTRA